MAGPSFQLRVSIPTIREEILAQTLDEIRGAGGLGELTGQECSRIASEGLQAWKALEGGGEDRDGSRA